MLPATGSCSVTNESIIRTSNSRTHPTPHPTATITSLFAAEQLCEEGGPRTHGPTRSCQTRQEGSRVGRGPNGWIKERTGRQGGQKKGEHEPTRRKRNRGQDGWKTMCIVTAERMNVSESIDQLCTAPYNATPSFSKKKAEVLDQTSHHGSRQFSPSSPERCSCVWTGSCPSTLTLEITR